MGNAERIDVLTVGDDSPGLNAATHGLGKAATGRYGMELIGFRDGVRDLAEDRCFQLGPEALLGILTIGGTILGTNRDKVHRMRTGGEVVDVIPIIKGVVEQADLDYLVMLGGGDTARNALRLSEAGIPVVHPPRTIDRDATHTDNIFGFSTALEIATDAINRLHPAAHSHHRVTLAETMGHKTGRLALGAGVVGGADVILIPEIPYSVDAIVETIRTRQVHGTNFSVIAVAEGANDIAAAQTIAAAEPLKKAVGTPQEKVAAKSHLARVLDDHREHTFRLARSLEDATGLETCVTIFGYVQRDGTSCAEDRLLGSWIGTAVADLTADGVSEVMVVSKGSGTEPVDLKKVAGNLVQVPSDHPWTQTARDAETGLGD